MCRIRFDAMDKHWNDSGIDISTKSISEKAPEISNFMKSPIDINTTKIYIPKFAISIKASEFSVESLRKLSHTRFFEIITVS